MKDTINSNEYNCLRNEIIKVRFIPHVDGKITNPKHVYYGGMSENAAKYYVTPRIYPSGEYKRVLSMEEQECLENIMGLKSGSLSPYLKENNYWENRAVRLTKGEIPLDLSNPDHYIQYKILLANKDEIAPSLDVLKERPKETYKFVLVSEEQEIKSANNSLTEAQEAWMNLGKIIDNVPVMKYIVESANGKKLSDNVKVDHVKAEINKILGGNPKLFNDIAKDPLLSTKVLIFKAVEEGVIKRRDMLYYSGNTPLTLTSEDPTLNEAAKYINHPKNQALRLSIEAKLNKDEK